MDRTNSRIMRRIDKYLAGNVYKSIIVNYDRPERTRHNCGGHRLIKNGAPHSSSSSHVLGLGENTKDALAVKRNEHIRLRKADPFETCRGFRSSHQMWDKWRNGRRVNETKNGYVRGRTSSEITVSSGSTLHKT